jgi:hypothetical protein
MVQFLSFIELVLSNELHLYDKVKIFSNLSCLDNDRWWSTMETLSWSLGLRVCKASLPSSTRCYGEATSRFDCLWMRGGCWN